MGMGGVCDVQSIRYFANIFLCEQCIIIVKYQLFVFSGTPVPVPYKKLDCFSVVIRGMYAVEIFGILLPMHTEDDLGESGFVIRLAKIVCMYACV